MSCTITSVAISSHHEFEYDCCACVQPGNPFHCGGDPVSVAAVGGGR